MRPPGRETSPHRDQPVVTAGLPVAQAGAAAILVHGRGATAESILELRRSLGVGGFAYLAPQARGSSWYPASFLAPREVNEPGLTSGLEKLGSMIEELEGAGIPASRTVLLGFSQGACLALEFAAGNPRRYGGILGFTGGLIGPPGGLPEYSGSLEGTPVFLGAGDPDPHVPWQRVEETARALEALGAALTLRRYPGMPHTINTEELDFARNILIGVRADLEGEGNAR